MNMYFIRASALAFLGLTFSCHVSPLNLDIVDPINAATAKMETRVADTAKNALMLSRVKARDDGADDTESIGLKSRDGGTDLKVKTRDDEVQFRILRLSTVYSKQNV